MNIIVIETTRKALNTRIKSVKHNLSMRKEALANLERSYKNKSHGVQAIGGGIGATMEYHEDSTVRLINEAKSAIERVTANLDGYTYALEQLKAFESDGKPLDNQAQDYAKKALKITSERLLDRIIVWRESKQTEKYEEGRELNRLYGEALNTISKLK